MSDSAGQPAAPSAPILGDFVPVGLQYRAEQAAVGRSEWTAADADVRDTQDPNNRKHIHRQAAHSDHLLEARGASPSRPDRKRAAEDNSREVKPRWALNELSGNSGYSFVQDELKNVGAAQASSSSSSSSS